MVCQPIQGLPPLQDGPKFRHRIGSIADRSAITLRENAGHVVLGPSLQPHCRTPTTSEFKRLCILNNTPRERDE